VRCRPFDKRGMGLGLAQCAQPTLTPDVVWDRDFGSGCASRVAMMQPADHREGDDLPSIGGLALAELRGVLAERKVGPRAVIVLEVRPQDAPQVLLCEDLLDAHRTHSTNEVRAIDLGPSVTLKCTMRRRSSTRNTYRMRNVAVGTTKKSMETRSWV
jgi:hypothetical protein